MERLNENDYAVTCQMNQAPPLLPFGKQESLFLKTVFISSSRGVQRTRRPSVLRLTQYASVLKT